MSESEGRTPMTHRIIAASKSTGLEVGRDRDGFHCRVTKDSKEILFYQGYRGLADQG
jgi:hypothetical protein